MRKMSVWSSGAPCDGPWPLWEGAVVGVSKLSCMLGLLARPSLCGSLGKAFSPHRPQGGRQGRGTLQPAKVWGAQLPMTGGGCPRGSSGEAF